MQPTGYPWSSSARPLLSFSSTPEVPPKLPLNRASQEGHSYNPRESVASACTDLAPDRSSTLAASAQRKGWLDVPCQVEQWPLGLKMRDAHGLAYQTLSVLVSYRRCFDLQQCHLLVEVFQAGLNGLRPTTNDQMLFARTFPFGFRTTTFHDKVPNKDPRKVFADNVQSEYGRPHSRFSLYRWFFEALARQFYRRRLQNGLWCCPPILATLQPATRIAHDVVGFIPTRSHLIIFCRPCLVLGRQTARSPPSYSIHQSPASPCERG